MKRCSAGEGTNGVLSSEAKSRSSQGQAEGQVEGKAPKATSRREPRNPEYYQRRIGERESEREP